MSLSRDQQNCNKFQNIWILITIGKRIKQLWSGLDEPLNNNNNIIKNWERAMNYAAPNDF